MNQGNIIQNGSAETLYTEPADLFAANFIGNYNVLSAQDMARLSGIEHHGQCALRPESITICAPGQGIPATILDRSLLGNVVRYRVVAQGVELRVDVLNRSVADLLSDGQQVAITLDLSTLRDVA